MTTKMKDGEIKSSRVQVLEAAYKRHQKAIQSALERRAQVMRSNMPVIVASAPDGTRYRIGCTSGGYRVLGVEQASHA